MPLQPSGQVVRDAAGLTLLMERRLPVPAADAWEWLTASTRLRTWIGSWKGRAAVGTSVRFTLNAENGSPTETVTIARCEPGSRLAIDWGGQRMSVALAEIEGTTTIYFSQELSGWRDAGTMGPGWEWCLDRLVAAQSGGAMPDFGRYLAVQRPYYERLALDGEPIGAQTETGR